MADYCEQWRRVPRWVWIAVGVMLLGAVGLGGWARYCLGITAINGTDECGACHIMQQHMQSLKDSQHNGHASCSDCHVPQVSFVQANMYKVKAGYNNVQALYHLKRSGQGREEGIVATDETIAIVSENCWRCHDEIDEHLSAGVVIPSVHTGMEPRPAVFPMNGATLENINCLDCHTGLVHDENYVTPSEERVPRLYD